MTGQEATTLVVLLVCGAGLAGAWLGLALGRRTVFAWSAFLAGWLASGIVLDLLDVPFRYAAGLAAGAACGGLASQSWRLGARRHKPEAGAER